MILFLHSSKFCLVFYQIYLKIIWITFFAPRGIYVTCIFSYTVDTGGADGAANFTQLDSDYSEPGKHVRTFDMMSVLHVA